MKLTSQVLIKLSFLAVIILFSFLIVSITSSRRSEYYNTEYERIFSALDSSPCWINICPGVTDASVAKQQFTSYFVQNKDAITYSGDDIVGGEKYQIDPKNGYTVSSITWENGIVNFIDIDTSYSNKRIDYFLNIFGDPTYIYPYKHWNADTPNYWLIFLYYPEMGIRIIAQNQSGSDIFDEDDFTNSITLFIPNSISNIFKMKFESYHSGIQNDLKMWHGFGDLSTY